MSPSLFNNKLDAISIFQFYVKKTIKIFIQLTNKYITLIKIYSIFSSLTLVITYLGCVSITAGNPLIGKDITNSSTSVSTSSSSSGGTGLSIGVIIGIILVALFLIGVALFMVYKYIYSKRKDRRNPSIEDNLGTSPKNGNRPSYSVLGIGNKTDFAISENGSSLISMELIKRVTNNFSEAQIIGKGGFGTVYKGVLPDDGITVAIKRMESVAVSDKGVNEFQAEIAVLSKVRMRTHIFFFLSIEIKEEHREEILSMEIYCFIQEIVFYKNIIENYS